MSSLNIILGLSGVGKSTVLEEAQLISDIDYKTINFGDKMFEEAKQKDLVEKRDEMKDLGVETYKELQKNAAKEIFEIAKDHDVILDTHAAIKTPHGYIPGLPKWTVDELDPDKLIMFTASAKSIYERSKSDNDRDREHEEISEIEEYQEIAREMASTNAVQTGAYLKIIENKDGKAQEAAKELIESIKA
jgi:adenylate kinase